ncbi:MurR/RpiR family transcriptional regulator [Orbaceae bacterium ac157xtp]
MLELKIREVKKDLSKTELAVANYILEYKQNLKNISIQALAKLNHVSTSTILRLCTKLGYSGFSSFKVDLISTVSNQNSSTKVLQNDINLTDSLVDVNKKVQLLEKSSIDETHAMVNLDALEKAVELIINSNRIIIFGVSSSGLVGKELEYQLIKIGKAVNCHFDAHIQFNIADTMGEKDLIIVISHSGETAECIELLRVAKRNNIPSIAITKMGQSNVSALAEVILHTTSTEQVSRLIPIQSKISQISVIDMLVTNIFIRKYDQRFSDHIKKRQQRKLPK